VSFVQPVRLDSCGRDRSLGFELAELREPRTGLALDGRVSGANQRRKDGNAMNKLIGCAVVSWLGLFACVDERQPEPEADPPAESTTESALEVCCIDYTCAPTGFETSGCVHGIPNPTQARQQCNAACSVACTTTGVYCN
jgi:hypothetical protein